MPDAAPPQRAGRRGLTRRGFLTAAAVGLAGTAGGRWLWDRLEAGWRAEVWIGRASDYDADLVATLSAGLRELGVGEQELRGRRILLKPNLVEPHAGLEHINTHPALIRAAVESFRRLGAEQVVVGEGPGHRRDSLLVLDETGLARVLQEDRIPYVDLNHDAVYSVPNTTRASRLETLTFPETLRRVDWIVSMPKLKTHHWTGVTLALKNLFGLMPGIVYGWPKNVLHWAGIHGPILDIYAAARPHFAIVDGIVGMEGDGPIMGTPRRADVLVMGRNFPAVDATCARVMGVDPLRIPYLAAASGRLGPVRAAHIAQRGERIETVRRDFRLLDEIDAQRGIRLL